eukprot:765065-Hanusia_phi.AAC.5
MSRRRGVVESGRKGKGQEEDGEAGNKDEAEGASVVESDQDLWTEKRLEGGRSEGGEEQTCIQGAGGSEESPARALAGSSPTPAKTIFILTCLQVRILKSEPIMREQERGKVHSETDTERKQQSERGWGGVKEQEGKGERAREKEGVEEK